MSNLKANAVHLRSPDSVKDRLLAKRKVNPLTGCWEWTACLNTGGYGCIRVDGAALRAHRVSHAIHNGPVGEGDLVLHSCDNRICINPAHLRVGTQSDNMIDSWDRQRKRLLTSEQVVEIRGLRNAGHSIADIADRFGLLMPYTSAVCRGVFRADVAGELAPSQRRRLSDEDVRSLRELRVSDPNITNLEIASLFNITPQHASGLGTGRFRPDAGGPIVRIARRANAQ